MRHKAQCFTLETFHKDIYEEQYQYLCDRKKFSNMKSVDWIDRMEVINKYFTLLEDKETDKLSKRKIVCRIIFNNIPNFGKRTTLLLKDGGQVKTC